MRCISKTDYILWRACPNNAWLRIHKPELYHSSELTEYERSVIDVGIEVEEAARHLFPDGLLVPCSNDEPQLSTTTFLTSHPAGVLFQAVFQSDGLRAAVDVLQYDKKAGECQIYEIKSSTEVKQEHLYDLAFQVALLRVMNIRVTRASILHVNAHYVRQGDLDIHQLFTLADMTETIDQMVSDVMREAMQARDYLLTLAEPSGRCPCMYKPRTQHCTTFQYSNPQVPAYGVHDIARIGSSPKKLRELVDLGILALEDIPRDIKLTAIQRAQLHAHQTGETVVDKEAIANELNELAFPLHFIDYETFAPPIPMFSQYCPYEQIPLQYSVHILGAPHEEPIHRDFLHVGADEPTTSFLNSLEEHVGSFGTIIVWNKAFESHVNDCIARRIPSALEYIIRFNDRIYDLKDIFAKQYFVNKELRGSVSIKKVLPILTPHLSYSPLAVHDGATASLVWSRLITGQLTSEDRRRFYEQLREYCALDSYGMYAIWRALVELLGS